MECQALPACDPGTQLGQGGHQLGQSYPEVPWLGMPECSRVVGWNCAVVVTREKWVVQRAEPASWRRERWLVEE